MASRPQHPSGKPVRADKIRGRTWLNVPNNEPLTPGLRRSDGAYAVGFTARIAAEDED